MAGIKSLPISIQEKVELPRRIGIIYSDVDRRYFPTESQYLTEKDAEVDARIIGEYIKALGITVQYFPGDSDLPPRLHKYDPDLVLNLVNSVKGDEALASAIPGVLELLDIPYTGADILGLSLDTNKFLIKKLLQQNGLPVPYYQLFTSPAEMIDPVIRFPLISKLNSIHGSVEITQDAVSENEKHLRKRLKYLIHTYKQPVIVEEFISGREITAIVLQDRKKRVYLAEKIIHHAGQKYVFVTFEDQWQSDPNSTTKYKKYKDPFLQDYIKKAFDVTRMAGYGKFDVRLDQSGRYFIIDSNCNPALGPKELDVAISNILDMYGVSFSEIIEKIILTAVRKDQKRTRT